MRNRRFCQILNLFLIHVFCYWIHIPISCLALSRNPIQCINEWQRLKSKTLLIFYLKILVCFLSFFLCACKSLIIMNRPLIIHTWCWLKTIPFKVLKGSLTNVIQKKKEQSWGSCSTVWFSKRKFQLLKINYH